ncbi:MAG: AbrB/MazE/SpoVT family DNA-binding domain-containing protein [Rhizobiaceae bacterium]|nr:AbrB/MazE/SpoVT family DNA-binding domain-containing protein [Rhizobiaceae bacterium]
MDAPRENVEAELSEKVRIAANGRLVLPKALRDAAGIKGETELVLTFKDGQIRISTIADRVRRAQELFRTYVKQDFSSDDFLATRERD